MSSIHVIARAVIIQNNHIVLCKSQRSNAGYYFFPGGHVEQDETAREALVRELREEMGLSFKIGNFLGCFEYLFHSPDGRPRCHTQEYNFLFFASCDALTVARPISQEEPHIQFKWVPLAKLHEIEVRPNPLRDKLSFFLAQSFNDAFASASSYREI